MDPNANNGQQIPVEEGKKLNAGNLEETGLREGVIGEDENQNGNRKDLQQDNSQVGEGVIGEDENQNGNRKDLQQDNSQVGEGASSSSTLQNQVSAPTTGAKFDNVDVIPSPPPQQQTTVEPSTIVVASMSKEQSNESEVQVLKDINVSIGRNNTTTVSILKLNKDVYYSQIGGTVVKHTINVLDDTSDEKKQVNGFINLGNDKIDREKVKNALDVFNGGKKKNSKKRGAKRSIKGGNSTSLTGAPFTGGRTRGHRGKNGKYGKKKSMKTYWGGSDTGANTGANTSATTLSPALYKGGSEKMAGGNSAPTVPLSSDLPGYTPNSLATTASAYAGGKRRSKKSKSTKKGKKAKRHTRK